jgi:hypothetical protein
MVIRSPDKFFYACDGRILKSLKEFAAALPQMTEEAYNLHAINHDWSKWVGAVLRKKKLARQLEQASKTTAEDLLKREIG